MHIKSSLACSFEAAIRLVTTNLLNRRPLPSYPEGFGPEQYKALLKPPVEQAPTDDPVKVALEGMQKENAELRALVKDLTKRVAGVEQLTSVVANHQAIFEGMEVTTVEDLNLMNIRELLTQRFGIWQENADHAIEDARVIRDFVEEQY